MNGCVSKSRVHANTSVLHARAKLGTYRKCNVITMAEFLKWTLVNTYTFLNKVIVNLFL
jgi:hypothetical protein